MKLPFLTVVLIFLLTAVQGWCADALPPVTVTVRPLEKPATAAESGVVEVWGMVEKPGKVPFKTGMSVLDAIMAAGGPKGKRLVGSSINITSGRRRVLMRYSGISGSFQQESWTAFYATVLIAEGDVIFVEERYW